MLSYSHQAKLARMARELDVAEARRAAANARPGPSRLVPGPLPSTSAAGRHESKGNLETDDSEACSQEEDSQVKNPYTDSQGNRNVVHTNRCTFCYIVECIWKHSRAHYGRD